VRKLGGKKGWVGEVGKGDHGAKIFGEMGIGVELRYDMKV